MAYWHAIRNNFTIFAGFLLKTMKRILTIILLFCSVISLQAQSFKGTFHQTKTMKVSGLSLKSKGDITYTAPNKLKLEYTNPEGDYFIISGDRMFMDMRGISLDVDTSTNQTVRSQCNALLYGISGQYDKIAEEMDADCTVKEDATGKHVVLKMRKVSPKSYTGMQLDYGKNGRVHRMVLEEFGGISTEYILHVK